MMDSVKKKKSYALVFIMLIILSSLFFMGFVSRTNEAQEPEEEETIEIEESSKPCEVREHYKVYLGIDEVYVLDDIGYISDDTAIASVKTNRVSGHSVGKTLLRKDCNVYEVEVTDMITAPYISAEKPQLECGIYSREDNEYLDRILKTKIAERGYQTRAGAVQAARFLVLQFPYHMNYFNENGRLPYVDGEGRYYHEGLYLNNYKSEEISKSVKGPACWGCSIYSIPLMQSQRNSLDCSGFVSWCLVNGGFDPGDLGAGPMAGVTDLSDLGEKIAISEESLQDVRVGDLFSANGHIGILIGIKDDVYYIAESDVGIDVRCKGYTKDELYRSNFTHWVDMDEFYGCADGKMNFYWE